MAAPRRPAEKHARLTRERIRKLDAEIERRGAEIDAGAAETITLEEYRAHVRARRAARAAK